MRKIILSLLVILLISTNAFCMYTQEELLPVRGNVSSNDGVASTIATGSGLNGSLYESFLVEAILTGSYSWIVTPLYNNGNGYMAGSGTTVSTSSVYSINTFGCKDIYFRVSDMSTASTITINVKPYRSLQINYKD